MKNRNLLFAAVLPAAILALPIQAHYAVGQKPEVRTEPVAGVYNKFWYNYVADINEADKELASDIKRATDEEDRYEAWEEYHQELADADKDYVKEMRERGYRIGRVTIINGD